MIVFLLVPWEGYARGQLFSRLGIALLIEGCEALGLGGCAFLGLRASLLPLR